MTSILFEKAHGARNRQKTKRLVSEIGKEMRRLYIAGRRPSSRGNFSEWDWTGKRETEEDECTGTDVEKGQRVDWHRSGNSNLLTKKTCMYLGWLGLRTLWIKQKEGERKTITLGDRRIYLSVSSVYKLFSTRPWAKHQLKVICQGL